MKEKDLFRAMTDIDDKFVLEASPDNVPSKMVPLWKKKSFQIISGLAAACFVFAIGLGVYRLNHSPKNASDVPLTETAYEDYYGYAPEDMEEQDNAVDIAQQSKDSASAVAETETEKESETETEEEIKRQK